MIDLKKWLLAMLIVCMLPAGGCGNINYPELPEEAVAFEPGDFAEAAHGGARYARLNTRAESISVTAP